MARRGVSLQCLNQADGPQDDTFLSQDLPEFIAAQLRVQQPGTGWGIAGYSEGGFCAANLALQHGGVYSFAGVLSGYFRPDPKSADQPAAPGQSLRREPPRGRAQHAHERAAHAAARPAGAPVLARRRAAGRAGRAQRAELRAAAPAPAAGGHGQAGARRRAHDADLARAAAGHAELDDPRPEPGSGRLQLAGRPAAPGRRRPRRGPRPPSWTSAVPSARARGARSRPAYPSRASAAALPSPAPPSPAAPPPGCRPPPPGSRAGR